MDSNVGGVKLLGPATVNVAPTGDDLPFTGFGLSLAPPLEFLPPVAAF